MFKLSRRTAVLAALVTLALGLAGCFGQEPAQRKAFIEFLQNRIINKPGLHIPIMSDQDVANFGPYADQYRIMNGFHHRLNAAISTDFARAMQIGSPRSLDELVQHRAMLPIVRQGMTKMKIRDRQGTGRGGCRAHGVEATAGFESRLRRGL